MHQFGFSLHELLVNILQNSIIGGWCSIIFTRNEETGMLLTLI